MPPNCQHNLRPCNSNILYFILLNKEVSNLFPQSATENSGIFTCQAQQNMAIKDQCANIHLIVCNCCKAYFRCRPPKPHPKSASKSCHLYFNITDQEPPILHSLRAKAKVYTITTMFCVENKSVLKRSENIATVPVMQILDQSHDKWEASNGSYKRFRRE